MQKILHRSCPVSVKPDENRVQSANWCVRFKYQGKRTCRSLGTADYRLANQRTKQLVATIRQEGWANATILPTGQGSLLIEDLKRNAPVQAVVEHRFRQKKAAEKQKDNRIAETLRACLKKH